MQGHAKKARCHRTTRRCDKKISVSHRWEKRGVEARSARSGGSGVADVAVQRGGEPLCLCAHRKKKNGNFVLLLSQLRARSRVLYSTPTLGGLVSVSRLETKKGTMPSF